MKFDLSKISSRAAYGVGFFACLGMMGVALVFQYVLGLEPCPLCTVARIQVIVLGLLFLVAWLQGPGTMGVRIYGVLTVLLAGSGIAISARHVWLQSLPEGQVPECGPGLEYLFSVLPLQEAVELILTGSGECHEVAWRFLGLSIPGWTLIAFALFAMFGFWQLTRPKV